MKKASLLVHVARKNARKFDDDFHSFGSNVDPRRRSKTYSSESEESDALGGVLGVVKHQHDQDISERMHKMSCTDHRKTNIRNMKCSNEMETATKSDGKSVLPIIDRRKSGILASQERSVTSEVDNKCISNMTLFTALTETTETRGPGLLSVNSQQTQQSDQEFQNGHDDIRAEAAKRRKSCIAMRSRGSIDDSLFQNLVSYNGFINIRLHGSHSPSQLQELNLLDSESTENLDNAEEMDGAEYVTKLTGPMSPKRDLDSSPINQSLINLTLVDKDGNQQEMTRTYSEPSKQNENSREHQQPCKRKQRKHEMKRTTFSTFDDIQFKSVNDSSSGTSHALANDTQVASSSRKVHQRYLFQDQDLKQRARGRPELSWFRWSKKDPKPEGD